MGTTERQRTPEGSDPERSEGARPEDLSATFSGPASCVFLNVNAEMLKSFN